MPIQIIDNFDLNAPRPIDNRFVVGPTSFYTHRDFIPYKYPGMRIWDLNDSIPYVWTGTTYSSENSVAVTGNGTPTRIPKLTLSNVIGDSLITDSGTNVGIGFSLASSATEKLHVNGNIKSDGGTGFIGFGGSITNLNASNITSGTMSLARLTNTSAGRILMSGGFPGSSTSPQWINSSNVSVGTASNLSTTNDGSSPSAHYLAFFPTSSGGAAKISSSKLQFTPQTGNLFVDGNVTSTRIIIGNQTNKATIVYSTNTSRTLTIPNVTGDRTFAFINESQTFSVSQFIIGSSETMLTVERTTTNGNNYTFLKANGTANVGIFYQNSNSARSLYMNATGNLITGGNAPNTSGFINFKLNSSYLYLGAESNFTPAIRVNGALVSGTSSVPAYSFHGATNSGMYCDGGDVAFSHQGARIAKFDRGMANDFVLFSPNNTHSNGLSMYNSTSTLQTQGNFYVNGNINAASKSFKINHPISEKSDTHYLIHSCIEGPKADNIYRGTVVLTNGQAFINLDEVSGMTEGTFVLLNRDVQCFTTNETGWILTKGKVTENILEIVAEANCSDEISWMVIGERQDKHMFDTDWTDENGKVIVESLK